MCKKKGREKKIQFWRLHLYSTRWQSRGLININFWTHHFFLLSVYLCFLFRFAFAAAYCLLLDDFNARLFDGQQKSLFVYCSSLTLKSLTMSEYAMKKQSRLNFNNLLSQKHFFLMQCALVHHHFDYAKYSATKSLDCWDYCGLLRVGSYHSRWASHPLKLTFYSSLKSNLRSLI